MRSGLQTLIHPMAFFAPLRLAAPRRLLTAAALFALTLAALPALAQQPPPAPPPATTAPAPVPDSSALTSSSTADLEALSRTLDDDAARARFSNELRALIEVRRHLAQQAVPAAAPEPVAEPAADPGPTEEELAKTNLGARLIFTVSSGVRRLSEQVMSGVGVLRDLPRVADWFKQQADNRPARDFWLGLLGKLALVLASGYLAEWLVARALAAPRRRVESNPAEGVLQRLLFGVARCCLDLLTIVAFAAAAYGVLTLVEPGPRTRLVILAIVNAHLAVRAVLALVRVLLAPSASRLRPLHLGDETAHYLYIWARRISAVVIYGYFAAEALLLLRFGRDAHELALKLVGLVTVTMLVIFVLQNRGTVAEWLRAHAARGAFAGFLGRLADLWHVLVATYLIAIYVVWILEVPNGFGYLMRATALTILVGLIARLLVAGADKLVSRAFRVGPDLSLRYPGLEARANRYLPVLSRVLRYAIYAIALLFILQAWGVQSLAWLTSSAGTRVVGTGLSVLLVLALALAAWEALSVSLERYAARLDAADPHSARARTLLPLIRTAVTVLLFVMVGLIVLSQIGIDITPLLAGAGVIGIAIGFGSQKLVQDVINGLFIIAEDTISVGDVVNLDGHGGQVEAITIRHIRLRDFDGSVWTLPFSEVKAILNMTKTYSRYVFDITVDYKQDVDQVIAIMKEIGAEMQADPVFGKLMLEPLEVVGVDKFGPTGTLIKARVMTPPIQQWNVGREFNRRLKNRFDAEGVQVTPASRTTLFLRTADELAEVGKEAFAAKAGRDAGNTKRDGSPDEGPDHQAAPDAASGATNAPGKS